MINFQTKIPAYENALLCDRDKRSSLKSACARQILRRPLYTHLGMIGSKNKVKLTRENYSEKVSAKNSSTVSMHRLD